MPRQEIVVIEEKEAIKDFCTSVSEIGLLSLEIDSISNESIRQIDNVNQEINDLCLKNDQ